MNDLDDKINTTVESYEPKTKNWNWKQKRAVITLNKIRYDLLNHYLDPNTIIKLWKKLA